MTRDKRTLETYKDMNTFSLLLMYIVLPTAFVILAFWLVLKLTKSSV